jgi:hypothetical protein
LTVDFLYSETIKFILWLYVGHHVKKSIQVTLKVFASSHENHKNIQVCNNHSMSYAQSSIHYYYLKIT